MNLPSLINTTLKSSESYSGMLSQIEERLPSIRSESEAFHKSSSQLKTSTLDVKDVTPIASARHILASITRTRQALEEANISARRAKVDLNEALSLAEKSSGFEQERHLIDADEARIKLSNMEDSVGGAIRKISYLIAQYDSILEQLGVTEITEEMYELDQSRHHVMTAFAQALSAARARGGLIDEGNLIYLFDLGINGAVAQSQILDLLHQEEALLKSGKAPTHQHTMDWLNRIGDVYKTAPIEWAKSKGMSSLHKESLLTSGIE